MARLRAIEGFQTPTPVSLPFSLFILFFPFEHTAQEYRMEDSGAVIVNANNGGLEGPLSDEEDWAVKV